MPDVSFDCVSCGACCFSRNPRYLQLLPWDAARSLPAESLFTEDARTYVKFACGHCVHLDLAGGKAVCGVYEDRPEACRAFRAGKLPDSLDDPRYFNVKVMKGQGAAAA